MLGLWAHPTANAASASVALYIAYRIANSFAVEPAYYTSTQEKEGQPSCRGRPQHAGPRQPRAFTLAQGPVDSLPKKNDKLAVDANLWVGQCAATGRPRLSPRKMGGQPRN